jgi:HAD superfamily hydrolase (TIGR01509 family)
MDAMESIDTKIKDGIKVVMFDLGNVLLLFSDERMFRQMAKVLNCDSALIECHLKNKGNLHRLESGAVQEDVFLRDLYTVSAGSANRQRRDDEILMHAMSDIFSPNQVMIDLLQSLKKSGIKLILVSNTSSIHFEFVKNFCPWLNRFDGLVLSYEINAMKPDPAFYSAALNMAQASPEACLFVDDIAENVVGAAKAGFQTHQYLGHDEFLRCLYHST